MADPGEVGQKRRSGEETSALDREIEDREFSTAGVRRAQEFNVRDPTVKEDRSAITMTFDIQDLPRRPRQLGDPGGRGPRIGAAAQRRPAGEPPPEPYAPDPARSEELPVPYAPAPAPRGEPPHRRPPMILSSERAADGQPVKKPRIVRPVEDDP